MDMDEQSSIKRLPRRAKVLGGKRIPNIHEHNQLRCALKRLRISNTNYKKRNRQLLENNRSLAQALEEAEISNKQKNSVIVQLQKQLTLHNPGAVVYTNLQKMGVLMDVMVNLMSDTLEKLRAKDNQDLSNSVISEIDNNTPNTTHMKRNLSEPPTPLKPAEHRQSSKPCNEDLRTKFGFCDLSIINEDTIHLFENEMSLHKDSGEHASHGRNSCNVSLTEATSSKKIHEMSYADVEENKHGTQEAYVSSDMASACEFELQQRSKCDPPELRISEAIESLNILPVSKQMVKHTKSNIPTLVKKNLEDLNTTEKSQRRKTFVISSENNNVLEKAKEMGHTQDICSDNITMQFDEDMELTCVIGKILSPHLLSPEISTNDTVSKVQSVCNEAFNQAETCEMESNCEAASQITKSLPIEVEIMPSMNHGARPKVRYRQTSWETDEQASATDQLESEQKKTVRTFEGENLSAGWGSFHSIHKRNGGIIFGEQRPPVRKIARLGRSETLKAHTAEFGSNDPDNSSMLNQNEDVGLNCDQRITAAPLNSLQKSECFSPPKDITVTFSDEVTEIYCMDDYTDAPLLESSSRHLTRAETNQTKRMSGHTENNSVSSLQDCHPQNRQTFVIKRKLKEPTESEVSSNANEKLPNKSGSELPTCGQWADGKHPSSCKSLKLNVDQSKLYHNLGDLPLPTTSEGKVELHQTSQKLLKSPILTEESLDDKTEIYCVDTCLQNRSVVVSRDTGPQSTASLEKNSLLQSKGQAIMSMKGNPKVSAGTVTSDTESNRLMCKDASAPKDLESVAEKSKNIVSQPLRQSPRQKEKTPVTKSNGESIPKPQPQVFKFFTTKRRATVSKTDEDAHVPSVQRKAGSVSNVPLINAEVIENNKDLDNLSHSTTYCSNENTIVTDNTVYEIVSKRRLSAKASKRRLTAKASKRRQTAKASKSTKQRHLKEPQHSIQIKSVIEESSTIFGEKEHLVDIKPDSPSSDQRKAASLKQSSAIGTEFSSSASAIGMKTAAEEKEELAIECKTDQSLKFTENRRASVLLVDIFSQAKDEKDRIGDSTSSVSESTTMPQKQAKRWSVESTRMSSGRTRGAGVISYAEPSLRTKLRQGDMHF